MFMDIHNKIELESFSNSTPENVQGNAGSGWKEVIKWGIVTLVAFFGGYLVRKVVAPVSNEDIAKEVKEDFSDRQPWTENQDNSEQEDAVKDHGDIVEEPYLIFDKLCHRREIVVLAAPSGVGKTLFACSLLRRLKMKTTYFALDDLGGDQRRPYNNISNLRSIDKTEFNQYLGWLEKSADKKAEKKAFWDILLKDPQKVQDRKNRIMKELGLKDSEKIDKLFLFELLVESSMCNDSDIIVLDSLFALIEYDYNICRPCMERITQYCRKSGKTLIIIHHTNKKNEIAGHSSLLQTVDLVLKMEKASGDLLKISVKKDRYLQGCNSFLVKRIILENHEADFEVCEETILSTCFNLSPLAYKILELLGDNETLSFDFIMKELDLPNENSLKNELLKLKKSGYLAKIDGHWSSIQNLHKWKKRTSIQ
jgi:ABC-type cobalamin/Fe3+-siderophores transport system ATPase subunit